jgi:hypothetical protein
MRKSLWIMLAVLVVAIGAAPNARADTFTYSYTDPIGESWSTKPITGVTGPTTVLAADLTATSNTGEFAGCTTTSVVLDFAGIGGTGSQRTNFSGCQFTANTNTDNFALSDYTTPGVYIGFGTLTVAAVTAPEPSSVALMVLGVGLVFVMRKRIGQGLPQAS